MPILTACTHWLRERKSQPRTAPLNAAPPARRRWRRGRRSACSAAPISAPAAGSRQFHPRARGAATGASSAVALPWGAKRRPTEQTGPRGFTTDNLVYEGSKFRSLYLPLLLIVVGLIFYIGQLAMAGAEDKLAAGAWVGFIAINFFADAILIFIALIIAVKFLDMGFGALGPAVLKIFAIAIGPGALGEIAYTALDGPMGELGAVITGGVIAIVLYYTLIKVLFQLDLAETIRLTGLIYFLRRWVKFFLLMGLAAAFMGSAASMDEDGTFIGTDDEISDVDADEEEESEMDGETGQDEGGAAPKPASEDSSGL